MTVSERLKDLVELNRLKHTRENEMKIDNHLIAIRKHIEEQDAVIHTLKTEYSKQYKRCAEIARMKVEKRKCIDCVHYKRCNRKFGTSEKSVECEWITSKWKAKE